MAIVPTITSGQVEHRDSKGTFGEHCMSDHMPAGPKPSTARTVTSCLSLLHTPNEGNQTCSVDSQADNKSKSERAGHLTCPIQPPPSAYVFGSAKSPAQQKHVLQVCPSAEPHAKYIYAHCPKLLGPKETRRRAAERNDK